ncbi:MAG TPA: hypothetical protein VHY19_09795 [Steroidobacteraceae bacterium]|jgi:hypothetical protein|nr:hypothetical protein [Steroidobacteraceae bacterium]
MQIYLIRVGADLSVGGGSWNGPVDSLSGRFVYVPIPERKPIRVGLAKKYETLAPFLEAFRIDLPEHLTRQQMHLDPDFDHGTYGDTGKKGAQLERCLEPGDRLVFYSGLRCVRSNKLVYALIGAILVEQVDRATDWPAGRYDQNAHTRRELAADAPDIIVVGDPAGSGRLTRCIPVGEYRNRAYRLRSDILEAWGQISSQDGYLQRSAVFPSVQDPGRFMKWWDRQDVEFAHANNIRT